MRMRRERKRKRKQSKVKGRKPGERREERGWALATPTEELYSLYIPLYSFYSKS